MRGLELIVGPIDVEVVGSHLHGENCWARTDMHA
jgi:hypothetical protein